MKSMRSGNAVPLGMQVNSFIQENSSERFSRGIRLQSAWEAIATPQALQHTDNVVFSTKAKESCVLVYVQDSHWAAELGMQKELYRLLLEKEYGQEIKDMKFLVTRKTAFKKFFRKKESDSKDEKRKKCAVPLTEDEDRHARELVSQIEDERLKRSLYKAIRADFEWKKGQGGLNLP
jgi:hypothetical protein